MGMLLGAYVYVTNLGDNNVSVIDANTNKVVREPIPVRQAVPLAVLPIRSHLRRSGQSYEPKPCQQVWRPLPLLHLASRPTEHENRAKFESCGVAPESFNYKLVDHEHDACLIWPSWLSGTAPKDRKSAA